MPTPRCARRSRTIAVWGRRAEAAQALALELRREGLPAHAATDLESATRAADIISCATTSSEALLRGAWLAPGTHLDLVGAFRPDMREVDDAAVQRARVVVDTYAGALAEAGDLTQPMARGADHARARARRTCRAAARRTRWAAGGQ